MRYRMLALAGGRHARSAMIAVLSCTRNRGLARQPRFRRSRRFGCRRPARQRGCTVDRAAGAGAANHVIIAQACDDVLPGLSSDALLAGGRRRNGHAVRGRQRRHPWCSRSRTASPMKSVEPTHAADVADRQQPTSELFGGGADAAIWPRHARAPRRRRRGKSAAESSSDFTQYSGCHCTPTAKARRVLDRNGLDRAVLGDAPRPAAADRAGRPPAGAPN